MNEYTENGRNGVSVGIVEKKLFTFAGAPDELVLDSGRKFGPISVAYETYGTLNDDKSNAVLVLHALSGDSHAAGCYSPGDDRPGWWDIMVGPGKGIDTNSYFVICANILGSCMGTTGPGSVNPAGGGSYSLEFPMVTIGDMVKTQKALIDHLGIEMLLAVVGGSIGGMQALEWALRYPDSVFSAIPIASTSRHSALAIAFNEVARQSIMADPNWNGGNYYGGERPNLGLAVARMIGHITYLSDESMRKKFGRRLLDKQDLFFNFDAGFQVESYLHYQGRKFVERFDANSFLYITKAADYFDLKSRHGQGSLAAAFSKTGARFLVLSFTCDWLYPTYQSREMVKAMKKNALDVSFCEIESPWGHDAFLLPNEGLSSVIHAFIDRMAGERGM